MKIFLKDIASGLISEFGSSLADHCIVFPNNRSILFFRKYLSEIIDRPMFMPSLETVSSLIQSQSKLKIGESVQLVYELYQTFIDTGKRHDTFDEFYYRGEMLLNDFDDIDKYLVNPDMLFSNLADLKEIDRRFGGMDEEVIKIIKQFWINFDASNMTAEKTDFLSLWEILPMVYINYKKKLSEKGLAYEGMIIREQTERFRTMKVEWYEDVKLFHFVGFNALNKCEKILLKELKNRGRARFYWDYDPSFIDEPSHEAGYFIHQNISGFGMDNKPPDSDPGKCKINIYSAPSDVSQAKLVHSIAESLEPSDDPNETAVILADENLLSPVLNSIPGNVHSINITMGYPLYQTPVYSLVHQLLRLHKNSSGKGAETGFYYNDVINILQHQYIAFNYPEDAESIIQRIKENNILRLKRDELCVNELFEKIFTVELNIRTYIASVLYFLIDLLEETHNSDEGESSRLSLQQEYIYSLILSMNQLTTIITGSDMRPGIDLYTNLVDRIMRTIVIPFSGEPLQGMQVMGILETRSLDFRNIILLSANEGKMPKSPRGNSFIPYNLREAFGLPTVKHSDSIYAYYLYRLLQRAENVNLVYNSSTDGMRSGEMSRFLLQLKYDERYNTSFLDTRFNILPVAKIKDSIKRNAEINSLLYDKYLTGKTGKLLSPSAINTWITCSMKFYYRYIAGIKEPEDILEEVDPLAFGNILHEAMKGIYTAFIGSVLDRNEIEKLLKTDDYITEIVSQTFRKEFMKNTRASIKGRNLVIARILERMVRQILETDKRFAPLEIVSLEKEYNIAFTLKINGNEIQLRLGGTIDRVDKINELYRIIDYKSGADSIEIGTFEQLFDYEARKRNSAAFQTLLYSEIFYQNNSTCNLRPSLYPMRNIFNDDFSDVFDIKRGEKAGPVHSYHDIRDHFVENLGRVLTDIFDVSRDITMTKNDQHCRYCPYNRLCNRMS